MKAKGYSAGGAPKSRAQRRATLSSAQRSMLDGVQAKEGSKQATSVIKDLSDEYGFKPGKRAGAKGGMGKGKRSKPPGMQMGGTVGMAGPKGGLQPAVTQQRPPTPPKGQTADQRMALLNAASNAYQRQTTRPTKATAMRGAAARRSGGSTPRGMNMGGAAMKTKGYAKGGAAMKTKGAAKGGARKPSSSNSGLYGRR